MFLSVFFQQQREQVRNEVRTVLSTATPTREYLHQGGMPLKPLQMCMR